AAADRERERPPTAGSVRPALENDLLNRDPPLPRSQPLDDGDDTAEEVVTADAHLVPAPGMQELDPRARRHGDDVACTVSPDGAQLRRRAERKTFRVRVRQVVGEPRPAGAGRRLRDRVEGRSVTAFLRFD